MLEQISRPVAALDRLTRNPRLDGEALELFLRDHSFPLQDGAQTTFVYAGEADEVRLHHWVQGADNSLPFRKQPGLELWQLTLQLPERSRIEYKIEVWRQRQRELLRDPLNPLLAHDPFGANSVCYGPGYRIPDWVLPDPAATTGSLESLEISSHSFREKRSVDVYLPASFDPSHRYSSLIVHDGADYLQYSDLRIVLDNLLHRREIEPLIVALVRPGNRLHEYAGDPKHARFLVAELEPWLRQRYGTSDRTPGRGLMGASFGAVASLHTAWLYPKTFGRLLLQSGSFVAMPSGRVKRGPEFRPVVAFNQLFHTSPRRVSEKIYISCGEYESLLRHNRELVPLLEAAGMEVLYSEARDGHNWENWRDRLREALTFLFPGPVYTAASDGNDDS